MSGCAVNRFNEKDDFQVVSSERNSEESSGKEKHSRWMARWTKASSSSEPQDGKSCSTLEDASNRACLKVYKTSPSELMKSRMAERLMLGRNHERISVQHPPQLNSIMCGATTHDTCQEAEQKKIGQRDGYFPSSMMQMQRDENVYAKTIVSEFSISRLSDLSLDFQKLENSDNNLNSQWSQFPMSTINHKIDSILNPIQRFATASSKDLFVPQQTLKLNMDPSNWVAFSSHEYELISHRITEGIMDHQCKPAGDPICLCSDPSRKELKGLLVTAGSSKQKGPCLFEMLTVPSKSQNAYLTDSVCSGVSSGFEICMCPTNIGSPFCGAMNQFSEKTETLHISKSSAGITSPLVQKETVCRHKGKSEQLATLLTKESSGHNNNSKVNSRFSNGNISQDDVSIKQEVCMPGTEPMNSDPMQFQLSRTRNQIIHNGTAIQPSPAPLPRRPESDDRWPKRLRIDSVHGRCSKRSKVVFDEGVVNVKLRGIPPDQAESVHRWVGRWCQGGSGGSGDIAAPVVISHEDLLDRGKGAVDIEVGSRGQSSGTAAMAMMGRAMTSTVRPFARQRKGACVTWKTVGE